MADELDQQLSDYDRLVREYAKVAGPIDIFGEDIQAGIEIEDFAASKPGKVLITGAFRAAREAIRVLVDAECTPEEERQAILELRVQHRVLQTISDAIRRGRAAQQRLQERDALDSENPIPEGGDTDE